MGIICFQGLISALGAGTCLSQLALLPPILKAQAHSRCLVHIRPPLWCGVTLVKVWAHLCVVFSCYRVAGRLHVSFFFVVVKKVSPSLPSPSLPLSVPSVHRAGWPLRGPEEGLGVSVHPATSSMPHPGCRLPARGPLGPWGGPCSAQSSRRGRTPCLRTGFCVSHGSTSAFGSQNEPCPWGPAGPWKDLGPPREAGLWVTRPPCSSQPGQVQLCLCLARGSWIRVCSRGGKAFK